MQGAVYITTGNCSHDYPNKYIHVCSLVPRFFIEAAMTILGKLAAGDEVLISVNIAATGTMGKRWSTPGPPLQNPGKY